MRINYIKLFLVNYIYLLILELTFKLTVLKTFDLGILYIIIFSLPIALLITFVSSLFKKRLINQIISITIWSILFLVTCAEMVYYSFYKTICGLSALMYGGQVMGFAAEIGEHIINKSPLIIFLFIPLLVLIILSIKKIILHDKYQRKVTCALFFGGIFMAITSLELNFEETDRAKSLIFYSNDLMQSTNKLGINTAIAMDAYKLLIGFEENIELSNKLPFTLNEEEEYNITNIDFDSLIEKEKDATLKKMHQYFASEEPTNQNEYTGVFAGKNLIFIVAEGFYPIAVDKDVTPTLYKMTNNGFIFNNFYQPIFNCSTSDWEFINSLSILPGVATCSMKETINKYLPYSLGNIMKDYGYSANAYHGWTYTYYNRDKTMPNLGYTYYGYDRYKKGYKYALKNIKDSWPTSDIDVINSSYESLTKGKRFLGYYMSISGHLQYNFTGGNAMSSKNKDAVKNMNASEKIKAYVASQVEFDRSLEVLLNNLKRDGLLDDTVIVISADHYPYGLTSEDISEYVDWMKDENFDLYKNNLIIYNSAMENVTVDKYTSSLDVLPTVLNLFGIEYDSRLLIGNDIFSDADDLVIFNNKSWITSKGKYDYMKKKFTPFTDEKIDSNYINEMNEKVKLKFQMSKLLISKDYYKKVLGG